MSRVRVVEGTAHSEEERYERGLRPQSLDEYVGQTEVVDKLRIAIAAARGRGEALDHVLFFGPPGLGKTTLAHIVAHEMGTQIVTTSGPAVERSGDLMGLLTNLEAGDVLFIDEIHRLSRTVEEFLYPAMEDFRVDFVVDKGAFARTVKVDLKPFTLAGATTRPGALTSPLRERFGLFYHLGYYRQSELLRIVHRSAEILKVPLDPEAGEELARRARGTPRIVNRLLKRARDYAQVKGDGRITLQAAREALAMEGVDEAGLDALDRMFLEAIATVYGGGPVGIEAVAATLNEEVATLTEMVEPFLLQHGYLMRTPSGRKLTPKALRHLGRVGEKAQPSPGDR